jgi:hypothetical protein
MKIRKDVMVNRTKGHSQQTATAFKAVLDLERPRQQWVEALRSYWQIQNVRLDESRQVRFLITVLDCVNPGNGDIKVAGSHGKIGVFRETPGSQLDANVAQR